MKYFSNMAYLSFGHMATCGLQRPYLPPTEGSLGSVVAAERGKMGLFSVLTPFDFHPLIPLIS